MDNQLLVADIIREACGKNDDKQPKSITSLGFGNFDEENNDVKDLSTSVFENPTVVIENHSPIVQVDLIFPSAIDMELKCMWSLLEKYGSNTDEYERGERKDSPICIFSFSPIKYNGKYFININEPIMWVNQPEFVGNPQNNVIRFFAYEDAVTVAENDDVNLREIELQAQREAERQEEMNYQAELRKIEEEDYQNQRNADIEELRRNGRY